jgi:transposase
VRMAQTVCILLFPEDRARLAAIIGYRNSAQKHVQRAQIILHSAEMRSVLDVARRSGVSRPAVWRWQQRYAEQGVAGLLRDKTRKPGKAPLPPKTVAKVLALTCPEPPGNATHWTGRAAARAAGISLRAVQRIWEAHRLQPDRLRTFKKSKDPAFAEKSRTWLAFTWRRPATRWCCPSMRKVRSRRSIARSQASR